MRGNRAHQFTVGGCGSEAGLRLARRQMDCTGGRRTNHQ